MQTVGEARVTRWSLGRVILAVLLVLTALFVISVLLWRFGGSESPSPVKATPIEQP